MKRMLSVCLAAILLFALTACKTADANSAAQPGRQSEETGTGSVFGGSVGKLTGSLNSGGFILHGVSMTGNQAGWEEDPPELVKNEKPCDTENIRVLFELNEWIEFTLDYEFTGEEGEVSVVVAPHRADGGEGDPELAVYGEKYALPNAGDPYSLSGEFCFDPDTAAPGIYDMLISCNGELVGSLTLHLFPEGGLVDKTALQLEALIAVG